MNFKKAGLAALALFISIGAVTIAWADDDNSEDFPGYQANDFIKTRTYIGVVGTSANIDQNGDFNGVNNFEFMPVTTVSISGVTSVNNPEFDYIPSITRQFGYGVLVGRRQGPWAAEVSFWCSNHTATFYYAGPVTQTYPASLQAINIDIKRYLFTEFPTQPFLSIGVSFPWLWVKNISVVEDYQTAQVVGQDDETISGVGLNLGAGVEIYLGNNFSLVGGLYERITEFTQINGAAKVPENSLLFDGTPTNIGALSGNGLQIYVGTTFGLK